MALILATALVAITALALPIPPNRLSPRDFPQPQGVGQGAKFDASLTFTIYSDINCNGNPAGIYTSSYGFYEAYQMQSYHLSRNLFMNETLDFYSGSPTHPQVDHAIDHSLDGHYTESCLQFDRRAGKNATTSDKPISDLQDNHGRKKGCHTLVANEWCAVIWGNSNNQPF